MRAFAGRSRRRWQYPPEAERAEFSLRLGRNRAEQPHPRRLRPAGSHDLPDGGRGRDEGLDHHPRHEAPQAAGKIHSDLERGFIRLEVYSYEDWVASGKDEKEGQREGPLALEGKEYVMREGDVCLFRFNV